MPAIKKKTEFSGFVKKNGNPFKNGKVASLIYLFIYLFIYLLILK